MIKVKIGNNSFELYSVRAKVRDRAASKITTYQSQALVIPTLIDFSYKDSIGVQAEVLKAAGEAPFQEAIEVAQKNKAIAFKGMNYTGYIQPLTGIVTRSGKLTHKKLMHMVANDFLGNRVPKNKNSRIILGDGSYVDDIAVKTVTENAIELANSNGLESIAFPLLGTDVYGMSFEESLNIMTKTISSYFRENKEKDSLNRAGIVVYGKQEYDTAMKILTKNRNKFFY